MKKWTVEDAGPYKKHKSCRDRPPGRSALFHNNSLNRQGLGGA